LDFSVSRQGLAQLQKKKKEMENCVVTAFAKQAVSQFWISGTHSIPPYDVTHRTNFDRIIARQYACTNTISTQISEIEVLVDIKY
jgi:hypothetical protein